jgi:hypothetical protein
MVSTKLSSVSALLTMCPGACVAASSEKHDPFRFAWVGQIRAAAEKTHLHIFPSTTRNISGAPDIFSRLTTVPLYDGMQFYDGIQSVTLRLIGREERRRPTRGTYVP